MPTNFVDKNNI